jgi:hypothetical protein
MRLRVFHDRCTFLHFVQDGRARGPLLRGFKTYCSLTFKSLLRDWPCVCAMPNWHSNRRKKSRVLGLQHDMVAAVLAPLLVKSRKPPLVKEDTVCIWTLILDNVAFEIPIAIHPGIERHVADDREMDLVLPVVAVHMLLIREVHVVTHEVQVVIVPERLLGIENNFLTMAWHIAIWQDRMISDGLEVASVEAKRKLLHLLDPNVLDADVDEILMPAVSVRRPAFVALARVASAPQQNVARHICGRDASDRITKRLLDDRHWRGANSTPSVPLQGAKARR